MFMNSFILSGYGELREADRGSGPLPGFERQPNQYSLYFIVLRMNASTGAFDASISSRAFMRPVR